MKITILTSDFSGNSLGRSYLLALLLQEYYHVRIVGPMFGEQVWPPLANVTDVEFIPVRMQFRNSVLIMNINKIVRFCNGDILYVSKPLISSFGIGIIVKYLYKIPLILDIDDWEISPFLIQDKIHRFISAIRTINRPISFMPGLLFDKLTKVADLITVSSKTLKEMYGGTIIPHVRKTVRINQKTKRPNNKKTIMFLGTPRPHKGVDDLIAAFKSIRIRNTVLKIIGIDYKDKESKKIILAAQSDNRIQLHGMIPFEDLKSYIATADIIVIPQRDIIVAKTQVPAKLFDAMVQGKAIISTRISDIPDILGDTGIIVEPGDIHGIKNALEYLLKHPEKIKELGAKVRKRNEMYYSFDATSKKLNDLITSNFNG